MQRHLGGNSDQLVMWAELPRKNPRKVFGKKKKMQKQCSLDDWNHVLWTEPYPAGVREAGGKSWRTLHQVHSRPSGSAAEEVHT